MPYFICRLFFTDTGFFRGKGFIYYYYLSKQRPSGIPLAFNFSDRFREVSEFYLTRFLNGIDLYNILKTLDFKIIPKSWGNFVFWYSIHLGQFSSFLHLHTSGSPSIPYFICRLFYHTAFATCITIICLNKGCRGKHLAFNFSDRFREVSEFYLTGFLNGIELYSIKTVDFQKVIPVIAQFCIVIINPPGSVFLILSFAPIRQSKYAIFYMQAVFTDTSSAHGKVSCVTIICLNKYCQENVWLLTFLTDSGRSWILFDRIFKRHWDLKTILKLFQSHWASSYCDTIHLGRSSLFLHLHQSKFGMFYILLYIYAGCFYWHWLFSWKRLYVLSLNKDHQEKHFNFSDRNWQI